MVLCFIKENDVAFKKKQQEDAKKMAEMKAAAGKKGPMSELDINVACSCRVLHIEGCLHIAE